MKRIRFPILIRGSFVVKIYRDSKPSGTYFRVTYHIGGKRHRLNFSDLQKAKAEAEAEAAQLSRGDVDAMQLNGERTGSLMGVHWNAIKEFNLPLDTVAREYSEARKLPDDVPLI